MHFYSTNNPALRVSFQEAVFKGLADDRGLFMPVYIPSVSRELIENLEHHSFSSIAFEVAKCFLQGSIEESELQNIIQKAINFPAPVIQLDPNTFVLELFHGPSLAFKDFGARFMAGVMSYFLEKKSQKTIILVATSGDTGGAVAAGFYKSPGIEVVILYPSGKVSAIQEKQLTTWGENITALEIEGSFDDCQSMVKQAFLDSELRWKLNLSSANSINIARLLPQSFYYFEGYKQVRKLNKPIDFVVPSGNFGNLTAGLMAKKMGLPVNHFVAATNMNNVVPNYLHSQHYIPLQQSISTLSNAMDVGNPSNFDRMLALYSSMWNNMKKDVSGYYISDHQTQLIIDKILEITNYWLDPHTAVGIGAWNKHRKKDGTSVGVVLGTAHPGKFIFNNVEYNKFIDRMPPALTSILKKESHSIKIPADFIYLKKWLLTRQ